MKSLAAITMTFLFFGCDHVETPYGESNWEEDAYGDTDTESDDLGDFRLVHVTFLNVNDNVSPEVEIVLEEGLARELDIVGFDHYYQVTANAKGTINFGIRDPQIQIPYGFFLGINLQKGEELIDHTPENKVVRSMDFSMEQYDVLHIVAKLEPQE